MTLEATEAPHVTKSPHAMGSSHAMASASRKIATMEATTTGAG